MNPITLKDRGLEFTLLRVIGQGRQAICYEAEDQKKSIFFVKKLKDPTDENKRVFKKAYEINQSLMNHHAGNSIATAFGYFEDENSGPFVVMPKITGNTLGKTHFKGLHELFAAFLRLSKAINQVHTAQFLTLDLSLENVYVLTDDGGMTGVYLHDFDNMLPMDMVGLADNIGTSFAFAAPEVLLEEFSSICRQTDYYSLAAMLHTLLFGYSPEADQSDPFRYHKTVKPYADILKNSVLIQNALDDFFRNCLALYPEDRYQSYAELEAALVRLCNLTHTNVVRPIRSNYHPYIPEHYVRQEKELELLKNHFAQRKNDFAMAIIHGFSGSGKTTLAHAFVYQVQKQYDAVEFCHWEPEKGFKGVLEQIGVDDGYDPEKVLRLDTEKVLMVIDNYDQETSEAFPHWGRHHFLFTSRYCSDSFNVYIETGECCPVDIECTKEHGKEIFHKVYTSFAKGKTLADEELETCYALIEDVEYHSYACDLLARRAARKGMCGIDSIRQLFDSTIQSIKDRVPGEKASRASLRHHLDVLFKAELEDAMKDPIQKEVLFFFSIDKAYNEKLLYCLGGDNEKLRRTKVEDAVENMEERGLVRFEMKRSFGRYLGNEIVVHPLVFELLNAVFAEDEKWDAESHIFRSLYNLYCVYQDESRTKWLAKSAWPSHYRKEVSNRTREKKNEFWNELSEINFVNHSWMHYVSLLDLINEGYGPAIQQVLKVNSTEIYYAYLEGEDTIFFVYTGGKAYPLLVLKSVYPGEKIAKLEDKIFTDMHGKISIRMATSETGFETRELWELPALICNNPVYEILCMDGYKVNVLRIPEGVVRVGRYKGYVYQLVLPDTLNEILPGAFFSSQIRELYIPESTRIISFLAFGYSENLERVTIAAKKIKIERKAFTRCSKLRELKLTGTDVEVEEDAFNYCECLEYIDAPKMWKSNNLRILANIPSYKPEDEEEARRVEKYRDDELCSIDALLNWTSSDGKQSDEEIDIDTMLRWTSSDGGQSDAEIDEDEVRKAIEIIMTDLGVDEIG